MSILLFLIAHTFRAAPDVLFLLPRLASEHLLLGHPLVDHWKVSQCLHTVPAWTIARVHRRRMKFYVSSRMTSLVRDNS